MNIKNIVISVLTSVAAMYLFDKYKQKKGEQ